MTFSKEKIFVACQCWLVFLNLTLLKYIKAQHLAWTPYVYDCCATVKPTTALHVPYKQNDPDSGNDTLLQNHHLQHKCGAGH